MNRFSTYTTQFRDLKTCVLIPTFNNQNSLKKLILEVLQYTSQTLIINDGSTDATSEILQDFPQLIHISFPKNKGKGKALIAGFRKAEELGYEYAITIDSDGQHYPSDFPVFLNALNSHSKDDPELLLIGARELDHSNIPGKSGVGNRVSSFWFRAATGINLEDTQCGFRLYPLACVNSLDLYTSKFELEIEVIVKAAWKGVKVKNIPVEVFYDPKDRVTHFKPVQDVARITLLYIYLLIFRIFYIFPQKWFGEENKLSEQCDSKTKFPLR